MRENRTQNSATYKCWMYHPCFFKEIRLKIHKTQKIRKQFELELTSKINNCLVYFVYFMGFLFYFLRLYWNKEGVFDVFYPILTRKQVVSWLYPAVTSSRSCSSGKASTITKTGHRTKQGGVIL